MPTSEVQNPTVIHTSKSKSVLVFMSSHNFREGLYDTVDIGFVLNLYRHQLTNYKRVIMTTIIPARISRAHLEELRSKENDLKDMLEPYGVTIEFFHIPGRTLTGIIKAFRELKTKISTNDSKFIWAKNYFNSFIGVLIKKDLSNTFLHSEMSGLVPEEEFFYSYSNLLSRGFKLLVLKLIEKVNLSNADSVSVVSKRFKEYIIQNHKVKAKQIEILPCYYDPNHFYPDITLRAEFRRKLQIDESQRVLLYSGMLQKWQVPDLLFAFFQLIQQQDIGNKYRLLLLTYDKEKAAHYIAKYGLDNVIVTAASNEELNGLYNAADIGLAFRSDDMVSFVSSPVKIPEYLATGNALITLEYIGDFGVDLIHKPYALVKSNKSELLMTKIEEIDHLERPDSRNLAEIESKYSILSNLAGIKRVLNGHNEKY